MSCLTVQGTSIDEALESLVTSKGVYKVCTSPQALIWLHSPLLQTPKQNTEVQLHSCPHLYFREIRRQ